MSDIDKIPQKLDPTERTPDAVGWQLLEQFAGIIRTGMQRRGWETIDLARRARPLHYSAAEWAARIDTILAGNASPALSELGDMLHALNIRVRIEEVIE